MDFLNYLKLVYFHGEYTRSSRVILMNLFGAILYISLFGQRYFCLIHEREILIVLY